MKRLLLILLLIPQFVFAQTEILGDKDLVGDGVVLKHSYSVLMDKPDSLFESEKSIWLKGQSEFPIRFYNDVIRRGSNFRYLSVGEYVLSVADVGDTVEYNVNVSSDTTYIYHYSRKLSDSSYIRYQGNRSDTFIMIDGVAVRSYRGKPVKLDESTEHLIRLDEMENYYHQCDLSRSSDVKDDLGRIDTTNIYLRGCSRRPICSNDRCPYYYYHARSIVYNYQKDSDKPENAQVFNTNKPSCTPSFSGEYLSVSEVITVRKSLFRRFFDWIISPFVKKTPSTQSLKEVSQKVYTVADYTLEKEISYKYDEQGRMIEKSVYNWPRKTIETTTYSYRSPNEDLSLRVLLNLLQ